MEAKRHLIAAGVLALLLLWIIRVRESLFMVRPLFAALILTYSPR